MDSNTHSVFYVRLRQKIARKMMTIAVLIAMALAALHQPSAFAEESTTTTPATTTQGQWISVKLPDEVPPTSANWGS